MLTFMFLTIVSLIASLQLVAQHVPQNPLERLSFMVGRWTGGGTGAPGEGVGGSTFEWQLGRTILMRTNFAEYAATKDRPASRHDDLMIVFVEGGKLRADYFDNEGHTIHYSVTLAGNGDSVEFLSDAVPAMPRYRLTYTKGGSDSLKLKFEIANPDKPAVFNPYIDATMQRAR